jgi:hypothetical protein
LTYLLVVWICALAVDKRNWVNEKTKAYRRTLREFDLLSPNLGYLKRSLKMSFIDINFAFLEAKLKRERKGLMGLCLSNVYNAY